MKKLCAFVITSAMATQAFAGSLNLDARFDLDGVDYNDAAGADDTSRFTVNTLRLDYKGKVNDDLSYRLRTRFNKDAGTVRGDDSLNVLVDYVYMTHKLTDGVSLTLGKLASEMGGFEGGVATPDHYIKSEAYNNIANNALYTSGLKLSYASDLYEVGVLALNDFDSNTTVQPKLTRMAAGAVAKLKLMDGGLTPAVSYHKASTGLTEDYNTYMTAGLRYKMGEMNIDLDYNMFTYGNKHGDDQDDSLSSIVLAYGHKFGAFKPVLKVEMSTKTDKSVGSEVKTNYNGVGAALEYYPIEGSDFRYHVAYTQKSAKADTTGATETTESHILAGFRINADFLK